MLRDDLAIVQTLDFITPVVDDPFIFGQIAAANSLSDLFAMGAKPLNALNIVGFDSCHFSGEILADILAGGKDKLDECGTMLVGGHSIETPEMYYGLSATGIVDPNSFWSNNTAKVGDKLILTKPLGSGIISTSIKASLANLDEIKECVENMRMLNFYVIKALDGLSVNACTDITGFGLLGHMSEMLNENISFKIYSKNVPILKSADKFKAIGMIPAGAYNNIEFVKNFTTQIPDIIFCDPQTSGGLLIAISEDDALKALANLQNAGYESARIIGEVVENLSKDRITFVD